MDRPDLEIDWLQEGVRRNIGGHNCYRLYQYITHLEKQNQWQPIETAPKDGARILLWIEHPNLKYAKGEDRKDWQGYCTGYWTNHNGGGWTWNGMSGTPTGWAPLPQPPSKTTPEQPAVE